MQLKCTPFMCIVKFKNGGGTVWVVLFFFKVYSKYFMAVIFKCRCTNLNSDEQISMQMNKFQCRWTNLNADEQI